MKDEADDKGCEEAWNYYYFLSDIARKERERLYESQIAIRNSLEEQKTMKLSRQDSIFIMIAAIISFLLVHFKVW